MDQKRKICVTLINRANYGRLKPVMQAIQDHPDLELQIIVGSSMLIYRYGRGVDIVRQDGFTVDEEIYMHVDGETPLTMAKSLGLAMIEFPTAFNRLKPDVVIVNADRYETLAIAASASYMNIPVAHTLGGEITGTIDDYVRHAVTKLADIHFTAHKQGAQRVLQMGENPSSVFVTGNPSLDVLHATSENITNNEFWDKYGGTGGAVNIDEPFLLSIYHPVTTDYGKNFINAKNLMEALQKFGMQTIMLWPNNDAGSDEVSKAMRLHKDYHSGCNIHFLRNLAIEDYLTLMKKTACVVGNSSSGIMEAGFLGKPTVNIGNRQEGREMTINVVNTGNGVNEILDALKKQVDTKSYEPDYLFGDGKSGEKIANILATIPLVRPKRFNNIEHDTEPINLIERIEKEMKEIA